MFKLSNETKVGILGVVALAILIVGYNYLKGKNVMSSSLYVQARFKRTDGLVASAPVRYRGYQVGVVTEVKLEENASIMTGDILVGMSLRKDLQIPKTAVAKIIQPSIMLGMEVELVFDGTCNGDCIENGAIINGISGGGYLADAIKEVGPLIQQIRGELLLTTNQVVGKLDSLMAGTLPQITPDGLGNVLGNLKGLLGNLNQIAGTLDKTLAASAGNINSTVANMESITRNLKESNSKISAIITNAEALTNSLNTQTMGKVNGTMDQAKLTMADLSNTLAEVNKAVGEVNGILQSARSGETNNALGMLLNDKAFAEDLGETVTHTKLLLQDFRLHPKRYIRIFRRKAPAYEVPANDPGLDKK